MRLLARERDIRAQLEYGGRLLLRPAFRTTECKALIAEIDAMQMKLFRESTAIRDSLDAKGVSWRVHD